jgi:hypothetical protein
MKTVTDKYLEMNHNFIELRDSIMEKIENEKCMDEKSLYSAMIGLGMLNTFLDKYKEVNEVKTKIKENDDMEESVNDYKNVIITDPKIWKSVASKENDVEESADNDCVILSNPNAWKSVKE